MKEELQYLIQLQSHDEKVDQLDEQLAIVEKKITAKKDEIAKLKNNLTSAKEAVKTNQAKKKSQELDAAEKEKLIQKHNGELNSIKSNDAYKAMLKEIENAKKDLNSIEDQILNTMEAIDASEKDLKAKEEEVKAREGILQGELKAIEAEKAKISTEQTEKKKVRDEFSATIPADLKNTYDQIRKRRGGNAIVLLKGSSCGGCGMSLVPSQINEVMKGKQLVSCETCLAIVYQEPKKKEETTVVEKASESASTPNT